MELRPGYTMTELGVLPEDWELRTLGELFSFNNGLNADRRAYGQGIPFISTLDVLCYSHIESKNIIGKVRANKNIKPYIVKHGDILFTRTSETQEEIGISSVYIGYSPVIFGGFIIKGRPKKKFFNSIYVGYAFRTPTVRKQIISLGQGGIHVNISQSELKKIFVPIPPLPEQHAIAAALSDVDALLDAQERLIAKKRNIKLAAMQQLLTGKTRLPGFQQNGKYKQTELGLFPEDWCHTELNMIIANIIGGGTPRRANPQFWNGNIPWVTVKDFATFSPYRTQEYITKEGIRSSATHLIPAGTLLIATRMALGKSAIYAVDVAINQDLKALFFKDYIDTKFIFYWFLWQESNIQALGSGSTVKGISLNLLKKINICCPPSLDEQRAIAAVLSDMDAELAALEARRDKLRAVKQGMMRELLTGRTRLAGAGGRHGQ